MLERLETDLSLPPMTQGDNMNRQHWEKRLLAGEAAYGFQQGFKLLYCPWKTIHAHDLTFLSLNPGQPPGGADLRVLSDERGNSYVVEQKTTRSPITEQFLRMCAFMGLEPARVLTGVVAPFRSDDWASHRADQKLGSLAIGREFWREVLNNPFANGPIVVCSGEAARLVVDLLQATHEQTASAGWGNISTRRYRGRNGRMIVQLPHLSRFKLFGRPQSEHALKDILLA